MSDNSIFMRIDEVHSLAADSTFADSSFCVLSFMEYAVEKGKIVVSGRVNRKYFYQRIDHTDKTEGG